ncbi:MAG: lipoate--protein ligase family protein [Armatimonadetes bacterium]|nr:lipoate--protein ligase family protein [Armatimonadota bacterium]
MRWSATTVEENLRFDERLASEAQRDGKRTLRLWWGGAPTVVLGCADKPEKELFQDECERRGITILRRVTGGSTVLQSLGVLNYSFTAPDPGRLDIHRMFDQGTSLVVRALSHVGVEAHKRGISDVAVGDRKISGNAQARKWRAILLHGTLLVDIDRDLMYAVLRHPSREPDYRNGRPHGDFVVTLRELQVDATPHELEEEFVAAAEDVFG